MSNHMFRALTRPTIIAKAPLEFLVIEVLVVFLTILWTSNIIFVLFGVFSHLVGVSLFKYDLKWFHIFLNYLKHRKASLHKRIWNARGYRP